MFFKVMNMLPLGGLELVIVPFALWALVPETWHPWLVVFFVAAAIVGSLTLRRRFSAEGAERRHNLAEQAGFVWSPDMSPAQYRLRLVTFLLMHGWRINESLTNAQGRVEVSARNDRCVMAMVCVGPPPMAADDGDRARLTDMKAARGATHAVLVAAHAAGGDGFLAAPGLLQIHYDDLEALDETLGMQVDFFYS